MHLLPFARALAARLVLIGTVLLTAFAADSRSQPAAADPLSPESFRAPPETAHVHVWWHWVDGAISRDGITKDLETMKAQGVVQATILNVGLFNGRDFGVPRVPFASPQWFEMYRWALTEASRLGITIGVHNCDGWSSSGGPWITPEQSMKEFTWTKTVVAGGRPVDVDLPAPTATAGLYRDVAVVAYRTHQPPSAFEAARAQLRVNGTVTPVTSLIDGNPVSGLPIRKGDIFEFSATAPLEFSRLALHVRRPFMWNNPADYTLRLAVESSSDGRAFRPLTEVTLHGLNHNEIFGVPATAARFVRCVVRDTSDPSWSNPPTLGELEFLRAGETPAYAPSIPFIGQKTGAIMGNDSDVDATGTDADAVAPKDIVELTARISPEGRLQWDAPDGEWAILRFGYTSTGATNEPSTREGRGLECDKLDPAAVEQHFHSFPEKLIDQAGDRAGTTLRFILVDSWEAGFQNWTAALPAEFARRRGYSLVPWLPVLTGQTVSSARESEAVLFDLRQTIADLIRENYYDRLAALLHARNIELHAEVIYGGAHYPPLDVLRSTEHVDLPMLEFWSSANHDSLVEYTPVDAPSLDLPPAAAVGYGKPLVGSEAYTGYAHYSETPAALTPFGSRGYAGGINRMILHSSVHQPTDDKPGLTLGQFASHFNRNNLYWPHTASWLEYHARIQSLLSLGAPQFDVFYFLGDQLPQAFSHNGSTTLPAGYAITAVNADLLATRISVAGGRLRLNGQGGAALLSLPPQPEMKLETLQRLAALIRDGAHVYGPKPERPLSLPELKETAEFHRLADEVWGSVDGKTTFAHDYGQGSVTWGKPIEEVLAALHATPQFAARPVRRAEFLFTHRVSENAEVFFVANQTDRVLDRECAFRVSGKAPEIRDPETGEITQPAAFRIEGDQLVLPVHFRPHQALLFVFRAGLPPHYVTTIKRGGTTLFPAARGAESHLPELHFAADGTIETTGAGGCTFALNDGRTLTGNGASAEPLAVTGLHGTLELHGAGLSGGQRTLQITRLRSLTDYTEPEIRYFSGEMVYRLTFTVAGIDTARADQLRLDLGGFDAIAEVSLNGEALGQLWRPGRALDVTGRLRRENELTVRVVNVYRNRLIGDLVQYGKLTTLRTSSPFTDFLNAHSPLKPSGLFGPITVMHLHPEPLPGL